MLRKIILGLFTLLFIAGNFLFAQVDPNAKRQEAEVSYGYCHLFYLTADPSDDVSFGNDCFVNDVTEADEFLQLRFVGPIENISNLFRKQKWVMHMELPLLEDKAQQIIYIESPADITEKEQSPSPGKGRIFLTDNRKPDPYFTLLDRVDYRAVSGKLRVARIDETTDKAVEKKGMKWEVGLDVYVQAVEKEADRFVVVGPRIRLKASFYIKDYTLNVNDGSTMGGGG